MSNPSYWIMKLAIDTTGRNGCSQTLSPQVSSEEERDRLIAEEEEWRTKHNIQTQYPSYTELVIDDLPAIQVGSDCMLYTFVEVPFDQTYNVSYAPHLDQPIVILDTPDIPFEGIYETPATENFFGSESYDVLMMNPY